MSGKHRIIAPVNRNILFSGNALIVCENNGNLSVFMVVVTDL
jgi:hypothetical protein